MKIFKYPIYIGDSVQVEMPKGAKILCVQMQNDMPCVWAMVHEFYDKVIRRFRVIGTGHDIVDHFEGVYIGTFQQAGGALVWHVFDMGEAS